MSSLLLVFPEILGWLEHFLMNEQGLPHSSYVGNAPMGGGREMERRERQCGLCPELVSTSHLRTLENPSSAYPTTVMSFGP